MQTCQWNLLNYVYMPTDIVDKSVFIPSVRVNTFVLKAFQVTNCVYSLLCVWCIILCWIGCHMLEVTLIKLKSTPMELNGVTCSARGVSPGVCVHWQVFIDLLSNDLTSDVSAHPTLLWYSSTFTASTYDQLSTDMCIKWGNCHVPGTCAKFHHETLESTWVHMSLPADAIHFFIRIDICG